MKDRVRVLGVSADSTDSHKKFSEKYSLPFPLLVDENKTLINLFGANGTDFPKRTTFLIDQGGVVRAIYRDFDCNNHAADVLRDLDAFGVATVNSSV